MGCDIVKMSKCFWCGGEKNELIFPKRQTSEWCNNKSMSVIANYDPCEKCQEKFDLGLQIIEVETLPLTPGQPELTKDAYPTGNTWVVKREAFTDIPEDQKIMLVTPTMAREIGLYGAAEDGK